MAYEWYDRRKKYLVGVKLDAQELFALERRAKEIGISKPELLRRMMWTATVLYDPKLTMNRAFLPDLAELDGDTPLADVLRPIPELASIIGIEHRIWKERKKNDSE